jgi:dCTP deaminase
VPFLPGQEIGARCKPGAAIRLIEPFQEGRISGCAYELTLGDPAYLTRNESERAQELSKGKTPGVLSFRELGTITIPPGKFALLLTDEVVHIPDDVLGFISIKAKKKWAGLINVSGFHVDPGFKGQLLFSVFNAGPADVVLKNKEPFFLIFFARLETAVTEKFAYRKPGPSEIPTDLIQTMSAPLASLQAIATEIRELRTTASDAKVAADASRSIALVSITVAGLAIAIALAAGAQLFQSINTARTAAEAKALIQYPGSSNTPAVAVQCPAAACPETPKVPPASDKPVVDKPPQK